MDQSAKDIARRLAARAEAVCRHYLPSGRRHGRYWLVGNVRGEPGRSLYVRLVDTERGHAGKWNDAATGEHGDLIDIIATSRSCRSFAETLAEARRFLALPPPDDLPAARTGSARAGNRTLSAAIKRILAGTRPITGTIAADYLATRALHNLSGCDALRFHPHLFYRLSSDDHPDTRKHWPAMIAKVTDNLGTLTGIHRSWLDPASRAKAPITDPRRSLGAIAGHAVRFGTADSVMIVGEGVETMLSLRQILPDMPMAAATSAAHLGAFIPPSGLQRLYIALDRDEAGETAASRLRDRTQNLGIETVILTPMLGDFNEDLMQLDREQLTRNIADQLRIPDQERFQASPC